MHLSPAGEQLQRARLKAKQQLKDLKSSNKAPLLSPGNDFYQQQQQQQQHPTKTKTKTTIKGADEIEETPPGGGGGIHNEASTAARSHRAGKLAATASAIYARRHQAQATKVDESQDHQFSQLYLDTNSMQTEVAAHIGQTAYLVCRLRSIQQRLVHDSLGGLQVSWRRNMQILTSGLLRFTSDERFQASHVGDSSDWVLEIHNVQASDEGAYECQVNSEPKPASATLYLRPMVASIAIAEGPRLEVGEGEQIRLTCRVEFTSARASSSSSPSSIGELESSDSSDVISSGDQDEDQDAVTTDINQGGQVSGGVGGGATNNGQRAALSSQHHVFWYKDGVSLEYNYPRGGTKLERHNRPFSVEKVLTLEGASGVADSGTYMCRSQPELSGVSPALVQVKVGGGGARSAASRAAGFEGAVVGITSPVVVAVATSTIMILLPPIINLFLANL